MKLLIAQANPRRGGEGTAPRRAAPAVVRMAVSSRSATKAIVVENDRV